MTAYEVKTGEAGLTTNQTKIYPEIQKGTAVLSDKLAKDIGVKPGSTFVEAFKGGGYEKIIEERGPSYTER